MRRTRVPRALPCILAVMGCALASARVPAGLDDAKTDGGALAGPKVVERERARASIVEREFDGKLKRLEQHPALVALDRLELTSEQRAKATEVVVSRNTQLDTIVRDNLRAIIEAALARQAGDQAAAQAKFGELLKKARPFLDRGTLLSELRPALPTDQYQQLKHAVDEYNAAAAQDAMDAPGAKRQNRIGAALAQGFEGFGLEVKASYERVFADRNKEFEELLQHLDLTPEQESKVRQKVLDLVQKTYGKPTRAQQVRVFLNIYSELTPEQRKKLAQRIGEERQAERGLPARKREAAKPTGDPMSDSTKSGS